MNLEKLRSGQCLKVAAVAVDPRMETRANHMGKDWHYLFDSFATTVVVVVVAVEKDYLHRPHLHDPQSLDMPYSKHRKLLF